MIARIFPATATAKLFTLTMICDVAYDFGLEDALEENPPKPETFFPADMLAHDAYWEGYWAGISLYYTLTAPKGHPRLFTCTYDSLEEITYYD